MIKKEDLPYDKAHEAIPLEQAIGLEIECEDGVVRKIERIVHSAGSFNLAIINEDLDKLESGHAVHLLKLFHKLRGVGEPSADELRQFDEIANSWDYKYVSEQPSTKKMTAIFKNMEKKKSRFNFKGRKN